MALYSYVKKKDHRQFPRVSKKTSRIFSITFVILGLFLVGQVIVPVFGSYLILLPVFTGEIVSPLASSYQPLKEVQAIFENKSDSYRPSTWFVGPTNTLDSQTSNLRTYTISIPKLKIKDAKVTMGGDDLKKSLVGWGTSALPGSYGVNIIFGHSELPALANPTNFSGIFTFIMDLKEGDPIYLDSDGVHYQYNVIDKKVIEPTDLSILEQRFDNAYLVLITCVPPGTTWKRGVIKAKLVT